MATEARSFDRLDAKRREQTPQALARLVVIGLFIGLWFVLWLARIPMPFPFLVVLVVEVLFFLVYWRTVFLLPSVRAVELAQYGMLAAEIVFHTTMVYFLGGISWLGAFAYMFGLIFANTFLDLRRGFLYTSGATLAFTALILLEATGAIPHYVYLEQGPLRYSDPRLVATTIIAGFGVFFSIYLWVNWVGHQLRQERDAAVRAQDDLLRARAQLQRANAELETRVRERTAEQELANAALRESEETLRATIESTADGILVVDKQWRLAYVNKRFVEMWHLPSELLETRDAEKLLPLALQQLEEPEAVERKIREVHQSSQVSLDTLRLTDGRVFEQFSLPLVIGGEVAGRVVSMRDITERTRAEEALREQASRDPLTGVLNHAAIVDELRRLIAESRDTASHAVAMVDVDGLKAVNDTYGHQIGDAVLVAIVGALSRDGALVGRYGGDEFVAILPGADRASAERFRSVVLETLEGAGVIDPETGTNVPVTVSIGLAIYPEEADTVADLVRLSDNAMYATKRQRPIAPTGLTTTEPLGSDRAAEMVGQIVPLLTPSGKLEDKLRLVAQRISVAAGYDAVNIDSFAHPGDPPSARNTFARVPNEVIEAWRSERRRVEDEPILQLVQRTRRGVIIEDPQNDERLTETQRSVLRAAKLRSAAVVPLFWEDELIGALSAASKREGAFTPRDVQFLTTVATQVTAIVRMATMVDELQSTSDRLAQAQGETMLLLAAAAEAHDHITGLHLQSVRALAEVLARELGYSEEGTRELGLAAVLHDIGKIRVPESVLASTGELTSENWELMKQHTVWGTEFLAGRPGFELAATIARSHHERWDGSGYPDGLSGEAIPEPATIVAVADSFDAMAHDRPYRRGRPLDQAVAEIVACSGTQFSPRVVATLKSLHEHGALPLPHKEDAGKAA